MDKYDINSIFDKLPAIASSLGEAVSYHENMIILEKDWDINADFPFGQLIGRVIGILTEHDSAKVRLLKSKFGFSVPNKDIVHRSLNYGDIYSSYFEEINMKISLKSLARNIDKWSMENEILCFPAVLIGFGLSYGYIVIFDTDIRNCVNELVTEYGYVKVGKNEFGIPTLGLKQFSVPYLNPCTPVANDKFSYVKSLDATTKKVLEMFKPVLYVLRSFNNRNLQKGYFIRVNLDPDAQESSLLEILELLTPAYLQMRSIYHGVVANSREKNELIMSGKLDQDEDTNLQLQSFLSEELTITDYIRGKFDFILEDESIFFNKNMIFTFYDLGVNLRFFTKRDYEKFFKLYNKSHSIQMATYVPDGEKEPDPYFAIVGMRP